MMTSVHSVLVVGGGFAGCALATLLGRDGVAVEIVERKPDFTVYGSGITLQGAALRVLREVGVWDELRQYGYDFDSLGIRSADGQLLAELPDARSGGPDLPATLGAYRPKLAELLANAAVAAGAKVRLGTSVESFTQDTDGVDVVFSDGDTGRYDLLVGADGVRSQTRRQLGIDVTPQPVGMGIWRVHATRPAEVTRTDLVYNGPCYIAGYCPTGPDTLYAYLVEKSRDRFSDTPEQRVAAMRELSEAYHGPWDAIREDITDPDRINYTHFESLIIDGPWNRGRAMVIGDAAHACPPTLALGAAMALEDASVLAELLLTRDVLDQNLFDAFGERRFDRAKTVVNGSMQLAQWLLDGKTDADVPGLMGGINALISQPA
jgi:2-polyprenyl-6-methoxyphenol hydroxylase-like FAD-dependent oxidoreductase